MMKAALRALTVAKNCTGKTRSKTISRRFPLSHATRTLTVTTSSNTTHTTTQEIKDPSPLDANVKALISAALEADRLMESVPSPSSGRAKINPTPTQVTVNSKLPDTSQQKCALAAARALLSVSKPKDLDLTQSNRLQCAHQVARIHRAYVGIVSWCMDVLTPDPTGKTDLLPIQAHHGNNNKTNSMQQSLWNVILTMAHTSRELGTPLPIPLYTKLLSILPQLYPKGEGQDFEENLLSARDAMEACLADISDIYGQHISKDCLQRAMLQWIREPLVLSDQETSTPTFDGVRFASFVIFCRAIHHDDVFWNPTWASEAVATLRHAMFQRFQHANLKSRPISVPGLDSAAGFVQCLEPTVKLGNLTRQNDENNYIDLFVANYTKHMEGREKFRAAMRQSTTKYKQYCREGKEARFMVIDNALISRLLIPSPDFIRSVLEDPPIDVPIDFFSNKKTRLDDNSNESSDDDDELPIVDLAFDNVVEDSESDTDEDYCSDYSDLYQYRDGRRFPDITNLWESWHGPCLYYRTEVEEILYARLYPEKYAKLLADRQENHAVISFSIRLRTESDSDDDGDDGDDSDDDGDAS